MKSPKNLRIFRARYRLSQAQIAAWLGVSQKTVSRIENGETAFTPEYQNKLLACLAQLKTPPKEPTHA